ncbi:MAG: hypothetical protein M3R05_04140 [Chloroflexota bacterium]|nr:hypothetical protein [Chloroflexota bacterium]
MTVQEPAYVADDLVGVPVYDQDADKITQPEHVGAVDRSVNDEGWRRCHETSGLVLLSQLYLRTDRRTETERRRSLSLSRPTSQLTIEAKLHGASLAP